MLQILLSTRAADYNFLCASYNEETKKSPLEQRVANVLYWYFFSKVIELIDSSADDSKEEQASGDFPTCLPSRHHGEYLVVGHDVYSRRTL